MNPKSGNFPPLEYESNRTLLTFLLWFLFAHPMNPKRFFFGGDPKPRNPQVKFLLAL